MVNRKNKRSSRKGSRKNRRSSRKDKRSAYRKGMYGGAYIPAELSLAQGREYAEIHQNQRGGGSWSGAGLGAPVGYQGLLPQELVASARVGPTLQSMQEISGMRDDAPGSLVQGGAGAPGVPAAPPAQSGGARKRRSASRKGRKASRKGRKASRKGRKASRKGRKASRSAKRMRGGAYANAEFAAPIGSSSMLLSPAQAAKAGLADFSNPLLKN